MPFAEGKSNPENPDLEERNVCKREGEEIRNPYAELGMYPLVAHVRQMFCVCQLKRKRW